MPEKRGGFGKDMAQFLTGSPEALPREWRPVEVPPSGVDMEARHLEDSGRRQGFLIRLNDGLDTEKCRFLPMMETRSKVLAENLVNSGKEVRRWRCNCGPDIWHVQTI